MHATSTHRGRVTSFHHPLQCYTLAKSSRYTTYMLCTWATSVVYSGNATPTHRQPTGVKWITNAATLTMHIDRGQNRGRNMIQPCSQAQVLRKPGVTPCTRAHHPFPIHHTRTNLHCSLCIMVILPPPSLAPPECIQSIIIYQAN